MSFTLSIDSTARALHLALTGASGNLIAYKAEESERVVESLSSLLSDLLMSAKISFDEIEQILVCVGPGSFTGIRSAIASALGVKLGTNCSLRGVSTHLARSVDKFAKDKLLVPYLMLNKEEACYVLITCGADSLPKTISDFYLIKIDELEQDIATEIANSGLRADNLKLFSIDLECIDKPAQLLSKAIILEDLDLGQHFQKDELLPLYVKGVNARTIADRSAGLA